MFRVFVVLCCICVIDAVGDSDVCVRVTVGVSGLCCVVLYLCDRCRG